MSDLPLRTDSKKSKKKLIFILVVILAVVTGGVIYMNKTIKDKKVLETKTETSVTKSTEEKPSKESSGNGKQLKTVISGFSKLYSDPEGKVFRTDIKQSEVNLLKRQIDKLENDKLKKQFNEDLEKVIVVD